jgi:alpha-methylacyl-CoA racemase
MLDGAASQMAMVHGLAASGQWVAARGANLLDGAAPFYRCYACADGGHVAVGAIEPQFFAALMAGLGLEPGEWDQADRAQWPALADRLAEVFVTRTRDGWAAVFAATDACVSPVLSFAEVADHPHNRARGTFGGAPVQPAPAPRFSGHPERRPDAAAPDLAAVLADWGE